MENNPSGFREFLRKRLVALKRKPQTIALVMLAIAFLYYSLNLTQISNTTARVQGPGMGLSGFATMLFSMLSLVCFLNAFPHRKKVNVPMLVLMLLMTGIVLYCDYYYGMRITAAMPPGTAQNRRRTESLAPKADRPTSPTNFTISRFTMMPRRA